MRHGNSLTLLCINSALFLLIWWAVGAPKATSTRVGKMDSILTPKSGLLESSEKPSSIQIELLHPHHVDSPFMSPNLTLSQRVQISVEASKERARFLAHKINGNHATTWMEHDELDPVQMPIFYHNAHFTMTVEYGAQPMLAKLIFDTAGGLIWLQCEPCHMCPPTNDPLFNPTTSHSHQRIGCHEPFCNEVPHYTRGCHDNRCTFTQSYSESKRLHGGMSLENFVLRRDVYSKRLAFGCAHENTRFTFAGTNGTLELGSRFTMGGANGMVGFGHGKLSLWAQVDKRNFSYCLPDYFSPRPLATILTIGLPSHDLPNYQYTYLLENPAGDVEGYYLNLISITIDGHHVNFPPVHVDVVGHGGFILDTTSPATVLVPTIFDPFWGAISNYMSQYNLPLVEGYGFEHCYDRLNRPIPQFPTVLFHFAEMSFELLAKNVFIEVPTAFCFAFVRTRFNINLFGAIQQTNFDIFYDDIARRVGFIHKICPIIHT